MKQKTTEDYLKAILKIFKRQGYARRVDIADELGVAKPTVTRTIRLLTENGFVKPSEENLVELTEKGMSAAQQTIEKYNTFYLILTSLGVDQKIAERDACLLEHDVSDESYRAILKIKQLFTREGTQ